MSDAPAETTVDTSLNPGLALSNVGGRRRSVVAGDFKGALVFALVDHAIAVIVDPVADLPCGLARSRVALQRAAVRRTVQEADAAAFTPTDLAERTTTVDIVNAEVAVVVETIADLTGRTDGAHALAYGLPIFVARLLPASTNSDPVQFESNPAVE